MSNAQANRDRYLRRVTRTRAQLAENQTLPRLSVHRSLRHIYAQIIDDTTGRTLAAANDMTTATQGTKTDSAQAVGKAIAEKAKQQKIAAVRFDRGGRQYHGRVAAVATAAREHGLQL